MWFLLFIFTVCQAEHSYSVVDVAEFEGEDSVNLTAWPYKVNSDENSGSEVYSLEKDQKCYGDLGCYGRSISGVFPSPPEKITPFFSFNTAAKKQVNITWTANPNKEVLRFKLSTLLNNQERPLIILAHGFGESLEKKSTWALNDAVLKVYPDAVTMLIDWRHACSKPLYNVAAANVALTARMTTNFFLRIMDAFPSIKAKNIFFIGFSLGGQLSGYFARQFREEKNQRIGRIAALDVAAPLFESKDIMPKKGDADFVEAVHTSAGNNILTGKFGVVKAFGDVDYYPNGGVDQPKCPTLKFGCSHQRARQYYTNALLNLDKCQLKGIRCDSVEQAKKQKCNGPADPLYIGMKDAAKAAGNYNNFRIISLKTSGDQPFCPIY